MKKPEFSPSGTMTQCLILLTGSLRTPAHLYAALSTNHALLFSLERSSVLALNLPCVLKDRIRRQKESKLESHELNYTDVLVDLTPFSPEPDLSVSFTKRWPWNWLWGYVLKYALMMQRLARERINSQSCVCGIGMNAPYLRCGYGSMRLILQNSGIFLLFLMIFVFLIVISKIS
ncbi:hypothetical protein GYMLUDRAFT_72089 [Collybiopsis luxurians FD-317 M1]|uniref:Uncharacterized protein n=1 Tax=Collybiopsis luxurians FD-317 M1 TaxID=944289 RepID=A0A0D0CKH0_9AGAR|nr:hypothetical protein GYMLUDRAFT_72089 [Collybiopsis luxurians FD-317 M1]